MAAPKKKSTKKKLTNDHDIDALFKVVNGLDDLARERTAALESQIAGLQEAWDVTSTVGADNTEAISELKSAIKSDWKRLDKLEQSKVQSKIDLAEVAVKALEYSEELNDRLQSIERRLSLFEARDGWNQFAQIVDKATQRTATGVHIAHNDPRVDAPPSAPNVIDGPKWEGPFYLTGVESLLTNPTITDVHLESIAYQLLRLGAAKYLPTTNNGLDEAITILRNLLNEAR